jgi:hypothetical protein
MPTSSRNSLRWLKGSTASGGMNCTISSIEVELTASFTSQAKEILMASYWLVSLVRKPEVNDFRSDYFPRRFHYKKDAMELKEEVARKGGEAVVDKITANKKVK